MGQCVLVVVASRLTPPLRPRLYRQHNHLLSSPFSHDLYYQSRLLPPAIAFLTSHGISIQLWLPPSTSFTIHRLHHRKWPSLSSSSPHSGASSASLGPGSCPKDPTAGKTGKQALIPCRRFLSPSWAHPLTLGPQLATLQFMPSQKRPCMTSSRSLHPGWGSQEAG